ncbi:MAG: alkaline phosphatase family protein [Syntrophobacteraceae bacterium]
MSVKIIVCLDGCGPEYLARSSTPNLDALAASGFRKIGRSIVPTVTNVNNTTIVTASYPESHGITSNYFLAPETGREYYMESSEFLLAETMFRHAAGKGWKSALLTAKNKLKTLICDGATVAESAEMPSSWLVDSLGPPPGIYDIELNHWLFRAAAETLKTHSPDLLYLTTTDYAMHAHAPEDEKSQWNLSELDRLLGEILDAASDFEVVVTADHGMNAKTRALDLNHIMQDNGITGNAIPIIKDRYVVHHQNMGGAAYVYLDAAASPGDAMALLAEQEGVESVMRSDEAAKLYHLHPQRIGHFFVLADKDTVFGSLPSQREPVSIRSHGSLHEREIPIIGCGAGPMSRQPESNRDVAAWVF